MIDLSGAFRATHPYGLVPWAGPLVRQDDQPILIANPGCYATAVEMALIPLLKAGALQADSIVIDAKSGTTGGGRKPAENLLLSESADNCTPYRVGKHQHLPEIQKAILDFAGVAIDPQMVTHLLPVRRGISAGIYAKPGVALQGLNDVQATEKLGAMFQEAYRNYPLVRMTSLESSQATALLSLQRISGTAMTNLVYGVQGGKVFVFSVIDNLMKGAATQAIENLNRILDLPVETGIR